VAAASGALFSTYLSLYYLRTRYYDPLTEKLLSPSSGNVIPG
jgi:hypothetical protein